MNTQNDTDLQHLHLQLSNLKILLEEATLRGSHQRANELMNLIRATEARIADHQSHARPDN